MKRTSLYVPGGLVLAALLAFSATDKEKKPAPLPPSDKVRIEPRIRPSPNATEEQDRRDAAIRVETQMVLINVTVTDPMNRFVTGLEKEHFQLFEDKTL